MPDYLFAYGTLQPGLAPAAVRPIVDRLVRIGPGSTPGAVFDLSDYPGARFDRAGVVHGTVYRLSSIDISATLATPDAYEGVPKLYVRLAIDVTLADGPVLSCWA